MEKASLAELDPLLAAALFVGGLVLICYGGWHRWTLRGRPAKNWLDASYIGGAEFLMVFFGGMLVLIGGWPLLALLARSVGLR